MMIKKLFYLFIFFAPFTSFFAISSWLRLPVVINQLLFIFLVLGVFQKGKLSTKKIFKEDILILVFLGLVIVSFLFGFKEKRSFNHTLAYANAILFYFFLSKYAINLLSIKSKQIAKIIYLSFIVISLIIISDFIGKNYFDFNIRNIFSEADGKISGMDYFIRFKYFRVGGVAEEPGTMALFYNIYFGFSLYYLYQKNKIVNYKWIVILFVASQFAMMSSAGITLPLMAVFLIFLINKLKKLTITKNQIFLAFSILMFLIVGTIAIIFFDVGNSAEVAEEFLNKILFNEDHKSYSSSGQRLKQWSRAIGNFIKHPIFGHGPGYGVDQDPEGYLSVYFTILADIGLIAFLFFLSFQKVLFDKVMSFRTPIRNFLLFSVITAFLHLTIVSDFYHAPIWILFVMIQLIYKEQKSVEI